MKDLAIYGAGGFGKEVCCLVNKINSIENKWNFVGFFDDGKQINDKISHFGYVLGGLKEINLWESPLDLILCFGKPSTISHIYDKIKNPKISFPNIIDPNFNIVDNETFSIGEGNIIKSQCSVTTNVTIGNFNILNAFISIGHDAKIGNFNVFMPGVRVSGEVEMGNCNLFGASSFIRQQLKFGNNITLSPLSALLTKPKDGNVYIGNPAKRFKF